jgi:aspartyl-tRNA(Asn)/glutamyl-tRNA(Gln) amidotransferase subunit A
VQAPHHDRHLRALHGYYDAYYLQAQKLRRMIADDFQACFQGCDLIAGPVAPTVAWKLGAQGDDPVQGLPGRHLHPARQPGRPARHERAGRPSGQAACRWACS